MEYFRKLLGMDISEQVHFEITKKCKFEVHSAIYSCESEADRKPTFDVTHKAQSILDNVKNNGVIQVNSNSFSDPVPGKLKSFAIVVSISYPEGNEVTKFCSCLEGTSLNVIESGVVCYF